MLKFLAKEAKIIQGDKLKCQDGGVDSICCGIVNVQTMRPCHGTLHGWRFRPFGRMVAWRATTAGAIGSIEICTEPNSEGSEPQHHCIPGTQIASDPRGTVGYYKKATT